MNNLKKLVVCLSLISVLAVTAFADGQCIPGQIDSPPCSVAQPTTDDPTAPGQTETPPAAEAVTVVTVIEDTVTALLLIW